MDTKRDTISFEEFVASVSEGFEQVAAGKPVTVERDGKLVSLRPKRQRGKHRGKPRGLTPSDPLLELIGLGGIIDAEGPTDVSTNKHKYLADAAADLHEPRPPTNERTGSEAPRASREAHDASEAV